MKKTLLVLCSFVFLLAFSVTAFAGTWKLDEKGWRWDNGDGTAPFNCWQWCDGNGDGIAECYYFDASGHCLMNSTTPDGYQVDGNGAWTENGIVQTQSSAPQQSAGTVQSAAAAQSFENVQNAGITQTSADVLTDSEIQMLVSYLNSYFSMFSADGLDLYCNYQDGVVWINLNSTLPVPDEVWQNEFDALDQEMKNTLSAGITGYSSQVMTETGALLRYGIRIRNQGRVLFEKVY